MHLASFSPSDTHTYLHTRCNRNDLTGFCAARCFLLYYTFGCWYQDVQSAPTLGPTYAFIIQPVSTRGLHQIHVCSSFIKKKTTKIQFRGCIDLKRDKGALQRERLLRQLGRKAVLRGDKAPEPDPSTDAS